MALPLGRNKVLGQIKQGGGLDSAHGPCVCHLCTSSLKRKLHFVIPAQLQKPNHHKENSKGLDVYIRVLGEGAGSIEEALRRNIRRRE